MMDTPEITDRFLELEVAAGFFDLDVAGIPVWERCRHKVYRALLEELGETGEAHSSSPSTKSKLSRYENTIASAIRSAGGRNPYLAGNHDVLVYGHSRRKQLDDGFWWDLYFDPLYEELDLDYLHLEKQYLDTHRTPARTENLRYMDFPRSLAMAWKKVGVGLEGLAEEDVATIDGIEREVEDEFGVELDIAGSIRHRVRLQEALFKLYRRLLARIEPEVALLVVSYGREPFIDACKNQEIPVVEFQHGVIHQGHMGYHFPGNSTKESFPDYLFTWGEFWTDAAEFPIPDERVISVGYPYLEQRREEYAGVEQHDQLLFISQGTIGEQLSRFAIEVARHPAIDHEVVYKLHPGEYDRWREAYPWLADADFEVVDTPDRQLYRLFAESSAQVGVGSTAVYEGLCFGLETFVYEVPGSNVLEPLVSSGTANSVSVANELGMLLGGKESTFNREHYFRSDATRRTCNEIRKLTEAR